METKIEEIWKPIPGYEGLYEVSSLGRVKALPRIVVRKGVIQPRKEFIRTPSIVKEGYLLLTMTDFNGVKKSCGVHRLVLYAFDSISTLPVDHINGNNQDNRICNLRYCTPRENKIYSLENNVKKSSKYIGAHWSKRSKKWYSSIRFQGRRITIGYFKDEYEAHLAYTAKRRELEK